MVELLEVDRLEVLWSRDHWLRSWRREAGQLT